MTTVIFDFDNTLFESQSHKARMFDFFRKFGVPEAVILETYEELVAPRERMYDMQDHRALIETRGFKCPLGKVDEFLGGCFKESLMPGAEGTLENFKARGFRLILLTKGIDSFQRIKIRQSGIEGFFDEIYTCTGEKEKVLEKMDLSDPAYFVNDSFKETERVTRSFPKISCILYAGDYGVSFYDPKTVSIPSVRALSELEHYIK